MNVAYTVLYIWLLWGKSTVKGQWFSITRSWPPSAQAFSQLQSPKLLQCLPGLIVPPTFHHGLQCSSASTAPSQLPRSVFNLPQCPQSSQPSGETPSPSRAPSPHSCCAPPPSPFQKPHPLQSHQVCYRVTNSSPTMTPSPI